MRTGKTLLLTAGLSVVTAATVAFAATAPTKPSPTGLDWYSVEILVFRYTGAEAAQGELWPRTVPKPSLAKAVDPSTGKVPDFRPIVQTSTLMSQSWQRLENASGYAPVLEIGWMQPGYDTNATRPVSLTPLMATAASKAAGAMTTPRAANVPPGTTTAPMPVSSPSAQSAFAPAVQADGTATLAVVDNKPYIQLNVRLCEPPPPGLELEAPTGATAAASALAAMTSMPPATAPMQAQASISAPVPASVAFSAQQPRQCFVLHQSHQVTPGQLEYFDTSAFGVLALVNPIKTPAGATTALPAAHTPD